MGGDGVRVRKDIAYISGKITGDPGYKRKFAQAREWIEEQGMLVTDPSMMPEGWSAGWYMEKCFVAIGLCDMVCMLPDWETSQGARLELMYAEYIGKPVVFIDPGEVSE